MTARMKHSDGVKTEKGLLKESVFLEIHVPGVAQAVECNAQDSLVFVWEELSYSPYKRLSIFSMRGKDGITIDNSSVQKRTLVNDYLY